MDFVEKLVNELIRVESAPRSRYQDHFKANIHETDFKLDLMSLKLPLFSVVCGHKQQTDYQAKNYVIQIKPGLSGQPTIKDKELLIFCISQVVEGRNRGRKDFSNKLRIVPHHFLKMFKRGTRGQDYSGLIETLQRLKETTFTIKLNTQPRIIHSFSLIQAWSYVTDERATKQRQELEVELPEITIKQIENRQFLTLSPNYVDIRSPTDRRIYELARSYCGQAREWKIGIQNLHYKMGCTSPIEKFKWTIKSRPALPDYFSCLNDESGMVTFKRKTIGQSIHSVKTLKTVIRTNKLFN